MASQNPIPTYFNPEIGPQYRGLSFEDVANSFNNGQQFSNQIQQQQQQGLLTRLLAQSTGQDGQVDLNKALEAVQSNPNQSYQPALVNSISGLIQQREVARLKAQQDADKQRIDNAETQSKTRKTESETNLSQLNASAPIYDLLSKGSPKAALNFAANMKLRGLYSDEDYAGLVQQIKANQDNPQALIDYGTAMYRSMLDPKFNIADANTVANNETSITNNKLTNQTSRENNQATVGATMRGQDITAQTAAAKLAQNKILAEQEYAFKNGEIKEIMTGTDGKAYAIYRDGRVELSRLPDGQNINLQGKNSNPQNEEKLRISRVDAVLNEIEGILPQSTSSYVGRGADYLARGVGMATSGDIASGKLGTLGGQLVALMPKMSGPQSDKDVAMYKQMAGQLDDATVPLPIRQAALETIRSLNNKYAEMNTQNLNGIPYRNAGQSAQNGEENKTNNAVKAASSKWGI